MYSVHSCVLATIQGDSKRRSQFNTFVIQLNFLGQTAASRCEVFPTFRQLTPSPSSGCAGGLVAPK